MLLRLPSMGADAKHLSDRKQPVKPISHNIVQIYMSQNFLLNTILHTENFEAVCLNLSFKVKLCANNATVNFLIFLGTGLIALKPVPKNLIQFWF